MEDLSSWYNTRNNIFFLELDDNGKKIICDKVKRTKVLASLGFVMVSLLITIGFFLGAMFGRASYSSYDYWPLSKLGDINGTVMTMLYLVGAALFIYPTFAFLKCSACLKRSLTTNNKGKFIEAVAYQKELFLYSGILAIVIAGLCLLTVLGSFLVVTINSIQL